MKSILTIALILSLSVNLLAQNSDQILATPSNYARLEQPSSNALFDTKISNGLLYLTEHNNQVWSLASFREFNLFRRPGLERALTLWGANSTADTYVEPLFIEHGTLKSTPLGGAWTGVNWDSAITIHSPRNPQNVTGYLHGLWLDDQHVTGGGKGWAIWYDGNPFKWTVEDDGSTWIYTAPYDTGNWARFGMWCESGNECYLASQSANAGIAPTISISGPALNVETDTVTVDSSPAFTGQCPDGTKPIFKKGIAIGCQ